MDYIGIVENQKALPAAVMARRIFQIDISLVYFFK